MAIDLADVVPLVFTTHDGSGNLADAGAVALTITLPDGTTATPSVTHVSLGTYQVSYAPTMSGRHSVSWVATGANASGYQDVFDVLAQNPPYLVSLASMKDQLNITGTTNDEALRTYIGSATDAVERIRNEAIVRRSITEEHYLPDYFRGYGQAVNAAMPYGLTYRHRLALDKSPAISLTSIARVDGTMTWDVTLLHLDPSGIVDVNFGPALSGHISVTYLAGYQVIPDSYLLAAEIIVEHLWQTRRGDKGAPRPGGMAATTVVPGLGFAIPNQAIELLGVGRPGIG